MNKEKKETVVKNRPSSIDIQTLRTALSKFEQTGGKSKFDQFLESSKYISYDGSEMVIHDPLNYSYWSDVHGYIQSSDWYALERAMKEDPKEKEAFMDMVRSNRPKFVIKKMPEPELQDYE